GSYLLENGSGLSHASHMSARQIAQVLVRSTQDDHFGRAYLASLSVAGEDGTLRSRFWGHPSAGAVVGKTGTLNGVAALSGVVSVDPDRPLYFAILTNGFRDRRKPAVRAAQAEIVDA